VTSPIAGITFLTYDDLKAGERFYGDLLGLPLVEDQGWAKVYRIAAGAHVGIVQARRATQKGTAGAGALVSLVVGTVEDVDSWHERLRGEPSIRIDTPPGMVGELPVYSLFLTDPAGYRVEIQAFTEPAIRQRIATP